MAMVLGYSKTVIKMCFGRGRDYVTGEMWKSSPPFRRICYHQPSTSLFQSKRRKDWIFFQPIICPWASVFFFKPQIHPCRLCLNRAASDEIIWHCKSGVLDTLGLVKEIDLGSTSIFTVFSLLGGDIIGYHFDIDPTFMINVASGIW